MTINSNFPFWVNEQNCMLLSEMNENKTKPKKKYQRVTYALYISLSTTWSRKKQINKNKQMKNSKSIANKK